MEDEVKLIQINFSKYFFDVDGALAHETVEISKLS